MSQEADIEEAELYPVHRQRRFGTFRSVSALVLREMSTSYGNSPLGYLWAFLEPIAGIAMLSLAFTLFLRSPPLGTNFPIFYATGMILFVTYSTVSSKVQAAILYSRPLLVYPSVTYVDALVARFLLNFVTQMLVSYIIFSGIRIIWETRTTIDLPTVAMAYAMLAVLSLGVGTMNCFLASMYPTYQRIWGIVSRPLMIASCVFYLYDTLPDLAQKILWWNPLVHIIGMTRRGFYTYYDASYVSPIYVFGLGLILTVLGLVFLGRYHREILSR